MRPRIFKLQGVCPTQGMVCLLPGFTRLVRCRIHRHFCKFKLILGHQVFVLSLHEEYGQLHPPLQVRGRGASVQTKLNFEVIARYGLLFLHFHHGLCLLQKRRLVSFGCRRRRILCQHVQIIPQLACKIIIPVVDLLHDPIGSPHIFSIRDDRHQKRKRTQILLVLASSLRCCQLDSFLHDVQRNSFGWNDAHRS